MKHSILRSDKFFQIIVDLLIVVVFVVEVYPLIFVLSCSLSDPGAVALGKVILLPKQITLFGYQKILEYSDLWVGYGNTIFYTVLGTLLNLIVTLPCAYALSRKGMVGQNTLLVFFMITMYVGGGLVPSYLNVRDFGLVNTRTFIIINGALSVYNLIVARSFFANTIPYEMIEAGKIDGADDFKIFSKLVLPLSKPITVVLMIYYGTARWNSYFTEMIYLDDRAKYPLQMILREILLQAKDMATIDPSIGLSMEDIEYYAQLAKSAELLKYCVIVAATLPIMLIYPWVQKYFEKGVMIGSVKG